MKAQELYSVIQETYKKVNKNANLTPAEEIKTDGGIDFFFIMLRNFHAERNYWELFVKIPLTPNYSPMEVHYAMNLLFGRRMNIKAPGQRIYTYDFENQRVAGNLCGQVSTGEGGGGEVTVDIKWNSTERNIFESGITYVIDCSWEGSPPVSPTSVKSGFTKPVHEFNSGVYLAW